MTSLLCNPFSYAEAETNKCTNGWQITYANVPCEKMGLEYAGPVKNRITIMPATPVVKLSDGEKVSDGMDVSQKNRVADKSSKSKADNLSSAQAGGNTDR